MLKNSTFCLLTAVALFLGGCVTLYNPATGRTERYFISEEQEIAIGSNMAQDIIKNNKTVSDATLLANLRSLGESLAAVSDRPELEYHFYILDTKELNAFALPGGFIFVNKGLIDATSRNELAFVLAHEIGHITARHSLKRLQTALGINLLLSLAARDPNYEMMGQAMDIVYNVISMGYSRSDELLSDSLAVKYTRLGGYEPKAGVSLLEKLLKAQAQAPRPPAFLSSHPHPEARIEHIRQLL